MNRNKPTTINKSALDVLSVLKSFNSLLDEASLGEVSTHVGLPKMKVFRALNTLTAAGFVAQNPANRKYRLHYALLELSEKILSRQNIRDVSHDMLQALALEIREDITVAVLDQDMREIVFVDRLRGGSRISFFCDVGRHLPLHVGAAAKSILAYLPESEFEAYLEEFTPVKASPFTVIDRKELRRQRTLIQKRGYAVSDQEVDEGVSAVGACILNASGYPAAALAIASLSIKMTKDKIEALGNRLKKTASIISADMGFKKD
ncbi:MAG: IclR family transcriptional regulator [Desulfobacterales bacterium]|nr:IclR family transcriptional regulator [Desulfobacterales bacterium]